ncbi:hypothetical protein [Sphingomonas sp. ERG5]|uniref:hypothetical protein n=1 Tax=Sphingomonas sp. ERG5 TaxID=1381597 RepID=UPI001269DA45|nr:hypothetical protein [Sphingomonas sp. ERG5]
MQVSTLDKEDVKCVLRKRHGSVRNWARSKGLTGQQVADFMRGRSSAKVAKAIAAEFQIEGHALSIVSESIKLDNSSENAAAQLLIAEAC